MATTCYYNHAEYGYVYDGNLSETVNGFTCQQWSKDTPHQRSIWIRNLKNIPVDASWEEVSNHCRGVKGDPAFIWCYTTDPRHNWDQCDVQQCQVPDCGETIGKAYSAWRPAKNTHYPAKFSYKCIAGFKSTGIVSSECQKNGRWSTIDFSCTRYKCKYPPHVPGARPLLGATDHKQFPSVIYYRCLPGYHATSKLSCDLNKHSMVTLGLREAAQWRNTV
ncbi:plasminogen-like [Gigantopelta aegis]|uniref:plasminogen-like n=1 Tax=Gigantopelta aegis TaxID=1735272 RepID=UPI001B88918D|nr:plasminogen-like [Gigantopelta aegis]